MLPNVLQPREADHVPVLAEEVRACLAVQPGETVIDATFGAGTPIVRAGDAGSAFYVLIDGGARVVTPKGRARKLGSGDSFGEMALLDDSPRSASVVAEGDVLTMTISRTAFGKLLRSEPALSQELLRTLAARLRSAEKTV